MLNFILALLAFMAMGLDLITALDSSITKPTSSSNSTIPIFERPEYVPCDISGNQGFYKNCWCFSDPDKWHTIDRKWMITAIDRACDHFTGGIGDPVSVYGTKPGMMPSYSFTFTYPPTGDVEEGKIVVAVAINRGDPACAGPRPLGFDECWNQLHNPLDSCADGGENGKPGGIYLDKCLYWVLDPAPAHNQPYRPRGYPIGFGRDVSDGFVNSSSDFLLYY